MFSQGFLPIKFLLSLLLFWNVVKLSTTSWRNVLWNEYAKSDHKNASLLNLLTENVDSG